MQDVDIRSRIAPRLIDALYVEAMVLSDEARGYFDRNGLADRNALGPLARVIWSCESIQVTTRLMHVAGWLLARRTAASGPAGDLSGGMPLSEAVGDAGVTSMLLPPTARALIAASRDLGKRVQRLAADLDRDEVPPSPARNLQDRLAQAF